MLVTLFSATFSSVQPALAATDATWSDHDAITYDGRTYKGPLTGDDLPNVVKGKASSAFVFHAVNATSYIIYFPTGKSADTATTAKFMTAHYSEPLDFYSDPSPPKTVSINKRPAAPSTTSGSADLSDSEESCKTSGIGWIVCPVSTKLAHGVDYLYGIITGFLKVEPLSTSRDNVIYQGWTYMRNIANVAFVIAFMIIIYSQVTNMGLSSYGLKKLLPRLVFSAILMNVSYWVCALGVDLSNYLGFSLENFFMSLRDGLMTGHSVQADMPTWGTITAAILGLGAVTWAGAAIVVTSGGVLALLLPILVGVALSALVAIIILAARQAILVILIIISPLAFVAFLLPNTDKYFKKWGDTYMTLLMMFPIFSVLFGGAQLAGGAIILSAHSIVELLFGMAIQVIPLAITPLLIKLSTSTLSQIAGIVNNPKRGLVDRTRNFSKQFNEDQRNRGMAYNPAARKYYHRKRRKEDRRTAIQARNDNLYHQSRGYHKIDEMNRNIEREKRRIESGHELEWHVKLKTDKRQFEKEMDARVIADQATAAKGRIDTRYEELKSGVLPSDLYPADPGRTTGRISEIRSRATDATRDVALTAMRKQMAERTQKSQLSDAMKANVDTIDGKQLLEYAGGIMGEAGERSAFATAKKNVSSLIVEDIQNIKSTMDYDLSRDNKKLLENFTSPTATFAERVAYAQAMAQNGAPGVKALRKALYEFDNNSSYDADTKRDFKELVATDGSILSKGKDLELYLTQAQDDSGKLRSFDDITHGIGTWTNLSAQAFATQAASTQEHALGLLFQRDKVKYKQVIDSIRNNPAALGQVKLSVREHYSIYSDAELEKARVEAKTDPTKSPLPAAGTYTGKDFSKWDRIDDLTRLY